MGVNTRIASVKKTGTVKGVAQSKLILLKKSKTGTLIVFSSFMPCSLKDGLVSSPHNAYF